MFWVFFRHHPLRPDDVYLLAGDEMVVSKPGACKHGLDRFFAGVYGRVIPGLAFFSLALISTQEHRSFPVRIEQVVRTFTITHDNLTHRKIHVLHSQTQTFHQAQTGAQLMFQFCSTLYERVALIVTTNLRFADWVQIFGDERLTAALLDRLTHHAHILEFTGADSYRFRQRLQREG